MEILHLVLRHKGLRVVTGKCELLNSHLGLQIQISLTCNAGRVGSHMRHLQTLFISINLRSRQIGLTASSRSSFSRPHPTVHEAFKREKHFPSRSPLSTFILPSSCLGENRKEGVYLHFVPPSEISIPLAQKTTYIFLENECSGKETHEYALEVKVFGEEHMGRGPFFSYFLSISLQTGH